MSENVIGGPWTAPSGNSDGGDPPTTGEVQVAGGGDGPHDPRMLARLTALEAAMIRIEPTLNRIDERTNHLATKAELVGTESRLMSELAGKATKGTIWSVGSTLAGLVVAAMAAGAIFIPYVASLLRQTGH